MRRHSLSLKKIHLRKLLKGFGLPENELTSFLREDIRREIAKENEQLEGGGDFHSPFWADAKNFVLNDTDLEQATQSRVEANPRRKRLYPALCAGFMNWWNNKRRFSNEKIPPYPTAMKSRVEIEEMDATVKVENLLGLLIGDNENRLIYPYFAESPALTEGNARMGLWLISKAFPTQRIEDFRILDVLRGRTFSTKECPFSGVEERDFRFHFGRLIKKWEKLKQEY